MNYYLIIAAALCFILGLVHSVIGELLIFNKLRKSNDKQAIKKASGLRERHFRIMWASWHLASIFGWCIGAIVLVLAIKENIWDPGIKKIVVQVISTSMFIGSALVGGATNGKHPGWIVLLAIGLLLSFGS